MKYIQPPKVVQYRANGSVELHITASSDIYYTTNGDIPSKLSTKYTAPIIISKNTSYLLVSYNASSDSYSRIIEYFAEVPKSYTKNLYDTTIYNKKE